MGSGSVSLPSRGSFHLSLTVLVRYRSVASIQPWRVGPPDSGGVSRVPPYLGCRWVSQGFAQGAVTRYGAPFQALALAVLRPCPGPATPGDGSPGLGYFRFRSPLLTESSFPSSPPATEMFHFAGSRAECTIWFMHPRHPVGCRVSPFGNLRIKDRMRLPGAYRSLPRPSSPATAKASAMRPYSLDARILRPGGTGLPPARNHAERGLVP